jgi:hypothetical protein
MAHNTVPIDGYHSGDTLRLHITTEDPDGNPIDIRDADITFAVAQDESGSTILFEKTVAGGEISITDGQNGEFIVEIQPGDTADLSGSFPYEVEVIDTNGDVATVLTGTLSVEADLIE